MFLQLGQPARQRVLGAGRGRLHRTGILRKLLRLTNDFSALPVSEHRDEILAALARHRVVIVCGDTGSGKTTQLPKMAVEAWIRRCGEKHGGNRRIACTQPRRLAAVTMAARVAEELQSEIGGYVGFHHRFGRKTSADTRITFMTDGILLAETRSDPLLRAYDTIIVDEAHERSLNVDFLLGILKRILDRRKDLQVIISSATIDTERFSSFFGNAPSITVPGRLFPVEIAYRPPPNDEERDLPRDIDSAVAELPADGDILAFLPGERDIRETAEYLRESPAAGDSEIIPLIASLPASEQLRAFRPSNRRRIILSTNVAETSVTIPGIRYVIDSGLARISRYIHRTHVQRLQIEPVSKASARQRAGRCGRLGPGICIRLYSEEDFNSRDDYTPPEILRSSLAGVILTMLDLRLGDIERFPFIDPPKPTMVREGLRELLELGAIARGGDADRRTVMTGIGRKLAKLPVEPRLARMLVAADRNGVLRQVLTLVAAMSCDDPRRRPIEEREKSDQAHARFRVDGSDFLGILELWNWWNAQSGGMSQSKARKLCRDSYLSYPKMREWCDLVRQLQSLCGRIGLEPGGESGSGCSFRGKDGAVDDDVSAAIHRSLMTGLLGRIGHYNDEDREYRGPLGIRFSIHPSSVLARRQKRRRDGTAGKTQSAKPSRPEWIMAGELVDTSQLYARCAAAIDVRWIEPVAGEICKHSYRDPVWDGRFGFVRATEQVTLYGLVIVSGRRCDYSRIDPATSREMLIRFGLVGGDFPKPPPVIRENNRLLDDLRKLSECSRRPEIFDEEKLCAHFAGIVPDDICSADALRKWLRSDKNAELAMAMKKSEWWPDDRDAEDLFPEKIHIAGRTLRLSYRRDAEDPEENGITCTVRQEDMDLIGLWRSDWLVPGLLQEKITWMLCTLPSAFRRMLTPIDQAAAIINSMLKPGSEPLESAFRKAAYERWGIRIPEGAWDFDKLPPHLKVHVITAGGGKVQAKPHTAATEWTFGDIPVQQTDENAGWQTIHYPALQASGNGVVLRHFADREQAERIHAAGVARLLEIALEKKLVHRFRMRQLPLESALCLREIGYQESRIASDILAAAIFETRVCDRPAVRTLTDFTARRDEDSADLLRTGSEIAAIFTQSTVSVHALWAALEDARISEETRDSVTTQLAWLVYPGFLRAVPLEKLRHYRRFLEGARIRLERARLSPSGDRSKNDRFMPYWTLYREIASKRSLFNADRLDQFRWMLEEYRISLFAQELHTSEPVSPKRLDALWAAI